MVLLKISRLKCRFRRSRTAICISCTLFCVLSLGLYSSIRRTTSPGDDSQNGIVWRLLPVLRDIGSPGTEFRTHKTGAQARENKDEDASASEGESDEEAVAVPLRVGFQVAGFHNGFHDRDRNASLESLCPALLSGTHPEPTRAAFEYTGGCYRDNQVYEVEDCPTYLRERHFVTKVSEEERRFPIAYSLHIYRNLCQFERFLAALYRPSNLICIHIDSHAPNSARLRRSAQNILKCVNTAATQMNSGDGVGTNPEDLISSASAHSSPAGSGSERVFFASSTVDVQWAKFSSVEAELICMRDLLERSATVHWRYYMNVNGHEWPLKTNGEIVRMLTRFDGANLVEGYAMPPQHANWRFGRKPAGASPPFPPERGIEILKGEPQILACHGFVDAMVRGALAKPLIDWLNDSVVHAPDESLYSTLNHNPFTLPLPGVWTGGASNLSVFSLNPAARRESLPFSIVRYVLWLSSDPIRNARCASGRFQREVCIFGVRDLPALTARTQHALFLNKIYWNIEPLTLDCLEHWLLGRVEKEQRGELDPDFEALLANVERFRIRERHLPCTPFQSATTKHSHI